MARWGQKLWFTGISGVPHRAFLWGCMDSTPYREGRCHPVGRDTVQSLQNNNCHSWTTSGIRSQLNPRLLSLPAGIERRHNAGAFQFEPYQTGGGGGGLKSPLRGYGGRSLSSSIWWTGVRFPPAPLRR